MKRKLYLAAFAAVAFASCNEILVNEPENKSGLVTLDLSVPVGETKSEGTEDERRLLICKFMSLIVKAYWKHTIM